MTIKVTPLLVVVLMLFLLSFFTTTEAFKKGPPVNEHPDICGSMSPKKGHVVEPDKGPLPFALTILSTSGECYTHDKPTIVKLATINNKTYFEGFLVQARLAQSSSLLNSGPPLQMSGVVLDGTFDTDGDSQLQTLTCGNSTHQNALGHSTAHKYYEKKFKWTPSSAFVGTIQFVATVVHEKDEYWMRVTSPTLRYDENCVVAVVANGDGSNASTSSAIQYISTVLSLVLAVSASLI